jgi:hypothetical protein
MNTDVTVALINGAITLGGVVLTNRLRADPPPLQAGTGRSEVFYIPSQSSVHTVPSGPPTVTGPPPRPQSRNEGSVDIIDRIFGPVWTAATRLRPLRRRVHPWLAAIIGYIFGGIGLALYFRSWTDVVAAVVLVLTGFALGVFVYVTTGVTLSFWAGAALPALYGYVRASASNRTYPVSSTTRAAAV